MKVSVVIPTLGRKDELTDAVESLQNQTRLADEIIVVDQNEPVMPDVINFLKTIRQVRHVVNDERGLIANYNRGLQEARGDIVIFLDDDIIADRNLIAAHLKNYEADPSLGGVAGRINNLSGDLDPVRIKEVGVYHRWTGKVSAGFNFTQRCPVQFGQGANMSFRRQAIVDVCGFDFTFTGNAYFFETDAGLRLLKSGFKIVFDPDAKVLHRVTGIGGARLPDKALHTYFYLRNGIKLYRRHSPRMGLPVFVIRCVLYALAKSIFNRRLDLLMMSFRGIWDGLRCSNEFNGVDI